MVKDSERGNPLPPHGLVFLISTKEFFYMHHPRQDNTYQSLYNTNYRALAGTQK